MTSASLARLGSSSLRPSTSEPIMLSLFQRLGLGTRKNQYPGAAIGTSNLIRVLQLRSLEDGQIHCKLKIVDVRPGRGPTYDALSYRWGDVADPNLIHCNGVSFKVQQSLFRALYQIWSQDPTLLIWVDAVCIDQNNLSELSNQVKFMGTIYQRARRVIVWLGEADEFTNLAWRVLLEALSHDTNMSDDLEARLKNVADLEDIWLSLHNLGQREWFYRAWTFQELYLAERVTVLCSEYAMEWDHFHRALGCLAEFLELRAASSYSKKAKNTLRMLLGSVENLAVSETAYTLTDLLSRTVHRSCEEPKDKIYALLGVLFRDESTEHFKYYFPVDYTADPELVYTRVSHGLALRAEWTEPGRKTSQPRDLSILHGAGLDAHNQRYRTNWFKGLKVNKQPGTLPSWVIDWTDHEAASTWAERTYLERHKWLPLIDTFGLKLGAAISTDDGQRDPKELLLYGVAIARLVRCESKSDDRKSFYLEALPHCATHRTLLSQGRAINGTSSYTRWTSNAPIEDEARYPSDSPSRIHYAPKVLRALSPHDKRACECFQAPFYHTIIASALALLASLVFRPISVYLFLVVCWTALKDGRVWAGKPSRDFRLDVPATKDHPTVASEGDWIVALAGEQGLFLLKPTGKFKFKLVRGLLEHKDLKPSWELCRIDGSGNRLAGNDDNLLTRPSWGDFRVLPISLAIV